MRWYAVQNYGKRFQNNFLRVYSFFYYFSHLQIELKPELLEEVEDEFRFSPTNDSSIDVGYGHGRIETRKCSIINTFDLVESHKKCRGMKSII